MASTERISKILDAVDWNFPGSSTPVSSVHSTHWFPGNFIPQIPSFLIQILSQPGDTVFDPFCGSGTTLVESVLLGRTAIASDVNRASVHVSLGKAALVSEPSMLEHLRTIQEEFLLDFGTGFPTVRDLGTKSQNEIKSWFHPHTFNQLLAIWNKIERFELNPARSVFEVLFTDTLFACASPGVSLTKSGGKRRHHWGWIADNVIPSSPPSHDVFALFRKRLNQALTIVRHIKRQPHAKFSIERQDARMVSLPTDSVDLVVTSPPYLGMIDYTLANRLTYMWMDWPLETDLMNELGARRFRNRSSAQKEYLEGIAGAAQEVRRVLKEEGYCAIVIGASRVFPDTVESVLELFKSSLTAVWGPTPRRPTYRRVADRQGKDQNEFICIFQKR